MKSKCCGGKVVLISMIDIGEYVSLDVMCLVCMKPSNVVVEKQEYHDAQIAIEAKIEILKELSNRAQRKNYYIKIDDVNNSVSEWVVDFEVIEDLILELEEQCKTGKRTL